MEAARILVVDDQVYFRVFMEDALAEEGFEVRTAASGEEALERLESERFDLLLTDMVMPGLDGCALTERVRETHPDLDVVIVTSVSDVPTAVEAMKAGAIDYLVKPLDRAALVRSLDAILERRRMSAEHARLLDENLDYMGAFSLYERALGLFANLSPESLADRIVEVLCLETSAHGGVLWIGGERRKDASLLRLAGVRGLVRVEDEVETLDLASLPPGFEALVEPTRGCFLMEEGEAASARPALMVPLRHGGHLLGVVRLTDKLDGREFGPEDLARADRFLPFGAQALANALRFRAIERSSFRDGLTGAYNQAYFEDVTRNEIRKASRFGRPFTLLRIVLDGAEALRGRIGAEAYARWHRALGARLTDVSRNTDLLAAVGDACFSLLLPETEGLGATVLKRRIRGLLERAEELRDLDASERPVPLLGIASFPTDGGDLGSLEATLAARIDEDRTSLVRALELENAPFRGLIDSLLGEAQPARAETATQVAGLLLDEVARRPHERGLLFMAPGPEAEDTVRRGLERLRDVEIHTDIVVLAELGEEGSPGLPVTWMSPHRTGTPAPFLVYYGDGPAYALVRDESEDEGHTLVFQTDDPVLVEQLAFQLGRDLGVPISG